MASRAAWINVGGVAAVGAATITAVDDTITVTGHGLSNGAIVAFDTLTGGADGPLVEGAAYFVRDQTTDTFRVSGSRGGERVTFDLDGTANTTSAIPSYTAQELRQIASHGKFHGAPDRLGAREGVRPGAGDPVTVAAGQYTINAHTGTLDPSFTSTQAPYDYIQLAQSPVSLDPADGSNDRIDALDVQMDDTDIDGSGGRGHTIVYVTGDPGSPAAEPTLTARSMRLATILVPANNTAGATVQELAQWTVASGGTVPVRDDTELPTDGLYDMMLAGDQSTGQVKARFDSAWQVIGTAGGQSFLGEEIFTTSGDFTIGDYPGAQSIVAHVQGAGGGGGGCSAADVDGASVGSGGAGGQYRRGRIDVASLAASETVTLGAAGSGGADGLTAPTAGGSSSFGTHITAVGGPGGQSDHTSGPGTAIRTGGASPTGGSGGDLAIPGGAGENGIHGAGFVAQQGNGGASVYALGGRGNATNDGGSGADAPGPGAGGSGGHDNNTGTRAARSGGDGGAGLVIVEVYG